MNVAVIGSRTFTDYDYLKKKIISVIPVDQITTIVSGGAPGADTLAEKFQKEFSLGKKIFDAEWDNLDVPPHKLCIKINRYGKPYNAMAGHNRNTDIINTADVVIAFWDGHSPGTEDSIRKAQTLSKKLHVFFVE